jgi:DNA-directed RNA polymerase specialized sigma subunit
MIGVLENPLDESVEGFVLEDGLLEEYQENYKNIVVEYEELQSLLAIAFLTLADNLARYKKFNHIDLDDAIQEGVMICFAKLDQFNPEMGKAFNYMTTVTLNHLRQQYRTARNYNELKKKYQDFLYSQVNQSITNSLKTKNFTKIRNLNSEYDYK